jgi:hypothetical protein
MLSCAFDIPNANPRRVACFHITYRLLHFPRSSPCSVTMDNPQPVPVNHLQGLLNKKTAQRTYLQGLVTSNAAVPFTHPDDAAPAGASPIMASFLAQTFTVSTDALVNGDLLLFTLEPIDVDDPDPLTSLAGAPSHLVVICRTDGFIMGDDDLFPKYQP